MKLDRPLLAFTSVLAMGAFALLANETNTLSITFTRVLYRIPDGKKLGAHHEGVLKLPKSQYVWKDGRAFVSADALGFLACEEMRKKGYNALGGENPLFGKDKSQKAIFQLGATVVALELNSYGKLAGNTSVASLTIEWQLNDRLRDEVVLKRMTSGRGQIRGIGNECVKAAFISALDGLLADPQFTRALASDKKSNPSKALPGGVLEINPELAKDIRHKAENGDVEAQLTFGSMYATGIGVEKSLVEAAKWHRFAAEQGTARGQYLLGLYYVDGSGVPRNYVEAYKWLSLAIAQDDSLGKDNLNALEKSMTPEQIAEAQRLAREFKPRKP